MSCKHIRIVPVAMAWGTGHFCAYCHQRFIPAPPEPEKHETPLQKIGRLMVENIMAYYSPEELAALTGDKPEPEKCSHPINWDCPVCLNPTPQPEGEAFRLAPGICSCGRLDCCAAKLPKPEGEPRIFGPSTVYTKSEIDERFRALLDFWEDYIEGHPRHNISLKDLRSRFLDS